MVRQMRLDEIKELDKDRKELERDRKKMAKARPVESLLPEKTARKVWVECPKCGELVDGMKKGRCPVCGTDIEYE